MKQLKSIEIIFENVDNILIPIEKIIMINIERISRTVHIYYSNNVIEYLTCDACYLKLDKSMEKEKTQYNNELFNRILRWKDITHIKLIYTDSEEMITMPWIDNHKEINLAQEANIDDDGNLLLNIDLLSLKKEV